MMEVTLKVEGMTCGHCEKAVKGAVEELPGITSVEVQLGAGKVNISYDNGKVTIADMTKAIEDQGYDVVM